MVTAWIVISSILLFVWLICFCIGVGVSLYPDNWNNTEERNEFFQYFAAVMAAAFVFAVAHWIILCLAVPVFLIYGTWKGVGFLFTKPWRDA